MKRSFFLTLIATCLFYAGCKQTPAPEACGPLPEARQLAWHELEFYAFVHFSINTYTDIEWGYGDKDPKLFNPSDLDCKQWVKIFKDAGMKGVIITAKHHDGFCLWPSKYTDYSVKASPWRNGKGDLIRELSDACKEAGLKFGIYLSPWDRNHKDYGKPEYVDYFRKQLEELMTNYGEIFEVWFDGANGGDGYYGGAREVRKIERKTYYDWENTRKVVYDNQPNAILFSDAGPGCRWCGNEEGWVRPTNWSILKRDDFYPGVSCDREHLRAGQEDGTHWVPAEVDVSIRPGWFYHKREDHKVKKLNELLDIYYHSVGRNASLLLNIPIDQRGLVHENDAEQLRKMAETLRKDFAEDLAINTSLVATNVRGNSSAYDVANLTDGNKDSYWATDDKVIKSSVTVDFGKATTFNRFLVQEYIKLGQRIKKFSVDALVENKWVEVAKATTIGYKRILRLPNITATKVRLNIVDAKACPVISNLSIYNAPMVLEAPRIVRNEQNEVTISAADANSAIYYTTDGSVPTEKSKRYDGVFKIATHTTIKAACIDTQIGASGDVTTVTFDMPHSAWRLVSAPKQRALFDCNPNTTWRTKSLNKGCVVDLGKQTTLKGFKYLPGQSKWDRGVLSNYELSVSTNGRSWKKVCSGEFSNIANNPIWQEVGFNPTKARYIKLKGLKTADEQNYFSIGEIDIITQ